jgi:hypothetical protein
MDVNPAERVFEGSHPSLLITSTLRGDNSPTKFRAAASRKRSTHAANQPTVFTPYISSRRLGTPHLV